MQGNSGLDIVTLGNGGSVQNLLGPVTVRNLIQSSSLIVDDSSDAQGHTSRDYSHFSCTVVPTAVSCPHTSIAPEGVFSRLGRALGFHDIEFESEEFNKAMKVNSADPQFATYLVDARMMQWLLDNKGWHFELCGRWVLAYGGRTKPKLIWGVIEAAREFHQHIPKVIDETYREGS